MTLSAREIANELTQLDDAIAPLLAELTQLMVDDPSRFDELALNLQELVARRQHLAAQWSVLEDSDAEQAQWLAAPLANSQVYGAQLTLMKQFFADSIQAMKANRTKVDLYKTLESKR